jgi:hypothetical protein
MNVFVRLIVNYFTGCAIPAHANWLGNKPKSFPYYAVKWRPISVQLNLLPGQLNYIRTKVEYSIHRGISEQSPRGHAENADSSGDAIFCST